MNEWDLSYLYASDELFEEDVNKASTYIEKFASFKGKLDNEKNFKEFNLLQKEFDLLLSKAYQYAHLASDLDKRDVANAQKVFKCMNIINLLQEATAFSSPEILAIGEEKVMKFIDNNKELEEFRFGYQKMFKMNEHILDSDKEKLLSYYGPVTDKGGQLYSDLCVADNKPRTCILSDGKEVTVTQGNWSSLIQEAKTEEDRAKIFETLYSYYDDHKNVLADIYHSILLGQLADVKARNYKSILESHLEHNNIPTSVFLNLIKVAGNNNASLKKYLKLKAKHLGLSKYHTYDRFMQLAKSDKKYSYDEAKELFFESVKCFPEDFQEKAHEVLKEGFVDVNEKPGKRSGAYSSSQPGLHPFILLNYDNTLSDVFTVAHEAGHSIHSLYAGEAQPESLQGYTIFVAEIASTFNEHNLLDYLMQSKELSKDEKIMLLQRAIDDMTGTFYRQALFAEYEYEATKLVENNQPVNYEVLSKIMIELYKKYYDVDITEEKVKQYVWAYIPHLFYTPFYVYQYATSFSASLKLYKNVKEQGAPAFERYVGLLKSGGSKYPVDQAKEAGVDFEDIETFNAVVERMDSLVSQLEKLLEE